MRSSGSRGSSRSACCRGCTRRSTGGFGMGSPRGDGGPVNRRAPLGHGYGHGHGHGGAWTPYGVALLVRPMLLRLPGSVFAFLALFEPLLDLAPVVGVGRVGSGEEL